MCDLLDNEGKESLEVSVCRDASEKSPKAFWAFRRLGYVQLHQNKWSEAVQCLQHAIRGYPTCADLWQVCLLHYSIHTHTFFHECMRKSMYIFYVLIEFGFAFQMSSINIFLLGSGSCLSALGQIYRCY